jgi:antitoxin component of MazEF toxin-antitoxin module
MPVQFERKIFTSGGSLRVNIPVEVASALGLSAGDTVLISVNDSQIVMQKRKKG